MATKASTPTRVPRLTAANVLKEVVGVGDWWGLGDDLRIPDSILGNIRQQHSDDRGRMEAMISHWLKLDPSPSWRRLINALDLAKEHQITDSIRQYAEPLTDPTLTLDTVTTAVAPVKYWDRLCLILGVPDTKLDEIREQHSTDEKGKEAAMDYWLHYCPVVSWGALAGELHYMEAKQSLKHVQRYLKKTTEPTLTLPNLCTSLVEVEDWYGLGACLCVPRSKLEEIKQKYPDNVAARREMFHQFLTAHPAPSWRVVIEALYQRGKFDKKCHTILQEVKRHYGRGRKELFDEAMKSGYVESLAIKVIITGAAGSGKTCSKEVILGRKPPKKRVSTKLAERPVRLDRAQTKKLKWETVTQEKIKTLLANIIANLETEETEAEVTTMETEETKAESTTIPQVSPLETSQTPTESLPPSSSGKSSAEKPKPSNESLKKEAIPPKAKTIPLASDTEEELLKLLEQAPASAPVLRFEWVYFIDSGGQPQFHEILPVFLKGASICIFVHKLSERLDEHPVIEYFDDNSKIVGKSCPSAHTNMQVFQHCIRTMQSHGSQAAKEKPPKILILGTHADLEHRCMETRQDKNQKLLEILLPTFPNEIIYNGQDKKEVIFPLNAQEPGEAEHRLAEQIRELIMKESPSVVDKIPLSWYVLEQALQELAQKLGRSILLKEECFAVASNLHFTEETFFAALQFLDDLNILFYYPDILPELVFTDPQVVLDKASELVKFSYQLREEPKEGVAFKGEWRKFQDYGLVTVEFLSEFRNHYVEGIFTPRELIKLFKALLIFADFSATEYFMPALLCILDCGEVQEYQSTRSVDSTPLVVHFPHGPRNGMFCSLITFLLSSDNCYPSAWKLHHTAGSPTCLNRNCVKFTIPEYAGSITLVDSFMHFEADVNAPGTEFCGFVQDAIFTGLQKAVTIFNYNNSTPKPAFLCPCKVGSTHVATVGANQMLICSKDSEKWELLQDKQKVWLPSTGPKQPTPATSSPTSSLSAEPRCKRPKLDNEMENLLCDGDLVEIKCYLRGLEKNHIYGLGLVLGLSQQKVKMMRDSDTFLDDVLAAWLRREDDVEKKGVPTWKTLVRALRHKLLGQTGIANDICRDKEIEKSS